MLVKTIIISLVLTAVTFFNACSSDLANKTSKCSDLAVIDKLSKILNTDSRKATVDIDTIRKKLDLTEQNGKRTCRARVDYTYGVDGMLENNQVLYSVVLSKTGKQIVSVVKQ